MYCQRPFQAPSFSECLPSAWDQPCLVLASLRPDSYMREAWSGGVAGLTQEPRPFICPSVGIASSASHRPSPVSQRRGRGAVTLECHVLHDAALLRQEAHWLRRVVFWAAILRLVLAVVLHVTGLSVRLAPDEDTYAQVGRALARYWVGDAFTPPGQLLSGQPAAYFYLNAISFYLFDSSVPLKLLNAVLGALVCRHIYPLAADLFDTAVARKTALLVAFLPSLVLWSSLNIRDIWVLFLLVFLSRKSNELLRGRSTMALFQVIAAIALVTTFRQYILVATAVPPLVALALGTRGHLARNAVLAFVVGGGLVVLVQQQAAATALGALDLETIAERRRFLAVGAGSAIEGQVDISTPAKALAFLPQGLLYFWFSPFPWQVRSTLQLLSVPEMLLIYALTPAIIRGVGWTLRRRLRQAVQVLLLTGLLTIAYALGSGNVGTLYRHRAQSIVFYMMFAAAGMKVRRKAASTVDA